MGTKIKNISYLPFNECMIRAIIAESETHSLNRIKRLLSGFPEMQVIGETLEGDIAASIVEGLKPDLLFLGIPLPGIENPEAIESFSYWPTVIFTLAYHPGLVRAFEQNSVDYLLKPFSQERFRKTVRRALQRAQRVDSRLREIFRATFRQSSYLDRLAVKAGHENLIIPAEKVYFFRAQDGRIYLHTYNEEYRFDTSLRALEEGLNPEYFCRIHRDHIISLQWIKKTSRNLRGQRRVILGDRQETRLPVEEEYFRVLKKKLNK